MTDELGLRRVRRKRKLKSTDAASAVHPQDEAAKSDTLTDVDPTPPVGSSAFARADGATRTRAVHRVQQAQGNAFVQRLLVQRQPDAEETARRAFIARGL